MGQRQIKRRIQELLLICKRKVSHYSVWPGDTFDTMPEMIEALGIAQKSHYHKELTIRALFDFRIKGRAFFETMYFEQKLNLPQPKKNSFREIQYDDYLTSEDVAQSFRQWAHEIGVIQKPPDANYVLFQDRQQALLKKAVKICSKRYICVERDDQYNVAPLREFLQNAFAKPGHLMPSLSAAYYLLKQDLPDYTLPIRVVKMIALMEGTAKETMKAQPPWRATKEDAQKTLQFLRDDYNYEKFN